ncbi:MAG TPA: zf-TFIIB domain-containing protein [Caulobacteraceae bacterium]|jgi:Zn-finger nucleic acid-binding protein
MKCPQCGGELVDATREGVAVSCCQSCQGLWLTPQELDQLEDETYDLGKKGSLVFNPEPSARACPVCAAKLQKFQYRDYELELELCPAAHGFWLDAGEDQRVIQLMKREEKALKQKFNAEDQWAFDIKHWRSPDILDRILTLIRLR